MIDLFGHLIVVVGNRKILCWAVDKDGKLGILDCPSVGNRYLYLGCLEQGDGVGNPQEAVQVY